MEIQGPIADNDAALPDEDDHTVMVDRAVAGDEDDHTVVVDRTPGPTSKVNAAPQPSKATRTQRRRGIAPPPVPVGFGPQAVEAVGVDATESYRPRDIPAPPPLVPAIVEGPAATREASAPMPSVAKHAQVTARVAVVVFAASCIASVVGLTLIAFALF